MPDREEVGSGRRVSGYQGGGGWQSGTKGQGRSRVAVYVGVKVKEEWTEGEVRRPEVLRL